MDAKVQMYGEAVKLPFRETGFYDTFAKLNDDDIALIKAKISELLKSEKYLTLSDIS